MEGPEWYINKSKDGVTVEHLDFPRFTLPIHYCAWTFKPDFNWSEGDWFDEKPPDASVVMKWYSDAIQFYNSEPNDGLPKSRFEGAIYVFGSIATILGLAGRCFSGHPLVADWLTVLAGVFAFVALVCFLRNQAYKAAVKENDAANDRKRAPRLGFEVWGVPLTDPIFEGEKNPLPVEAGYVVVSVVAGAEDIAVPVCVSNVGRVDGRAAEAVQVGIRLLSSSGFIDTIEGGWSGGKEGEDGIAMRTRVKMPLLPKDRQSLGFLTFKPQPIESFAIPIWVFLRAKEVEPVYFSFWITCVRWPHQKGARVITGKKGMAVAHIPNWIPGKLPLWVTPPHLLEPPAVK